MANQKRKDEITQICCVLDAFLDKTFPFGFEFDHSRYGVAMTAKYAGSESIVVCLYFAYDKPLSDMRIMFLGAKSQYHNRKLDLRAKISQEVLETLEKICIGREQFHLFVSQQAS